MFAIPQNSIIKGMILEWYSTIASIPTGWGFCDGTQGTPDLRDTFPVGAKEDDGGVPKTNITGSLTANGGNINHTHDTGADEAVQDEDTGVDVWPSAVSSTVNSAVCVPYTARVFMMKL